METCPVEAGNCSTTPCPSCPPGTIVDQDPRVGEPCKVYVQVTNRGTSAATNLRVIALWADASAGLPTLPADYWTRVFKANGACESIAAGEKWQTLSPVCGTLPRLEANASHVFEYDWTPPEGAATHSCVMAMVECTVMTRVA